MARHPIQRLLLLVVFGIPVFNIEAPIALGQPLPMEFADVAASVFTRGAEINEYVMHPGRAAHVGPDWDEGPPHLVQVSEFRISRRQISMKQFTMFMPEYRERVGSYGATWSDDSPAVLVDWEEANEYCQWLSSQSEKNYGLPTEAQWELAAKSADALNLSGISDGIQEWCRDWWAPYEQSPASRLTNPQGPYGGLVRVVRDGGGGSVEEEKIRQENDPVVDYRPTDRSGTVPDDRRRNLGFRIVVADSPEFESRAQIEVAVPQYANTVIFADIDQKPVEWASLDAGPEPSFLAGGEFINPPQDHRSTLPYWNRHHVPSLTWCDNGDLLATAFTAAFDNSDQMAVLIARLPWGSKTWRPPARFFVAPDRNITSAVLFNAGAGVLHHYNGLGDNHCEDFSMIKRESRDNGATWSKPKIVHRYPTAPASDNNPDGPPRLWPHMDLKRLTSSDGPQTLLMSTDVAGGNDSGSALFISKDDGASWNELTRTGWNRTEFATPQGTAGWIAGIHAPVEQLKDHSLLAIGRSNNIEGLAPLSRSSDFGKSWTYSASSFPPILSGQRPVLMRLQEGALLLISFTDSTVLVRDKKATGMDFVDTAGNKHRGFGLFATISQDEGQTWSHRKLIPNWEGKPWRSRYGGYLSCVQSPDGMIHLVSSSYYYRFNLAWLKTPMPAPE